MKIQALNLVVDLNHDGRYSGWELWEAIKFLYRLPGNLITEALGHIPYVSSTLGIHASEASGYASLNGLFAVTLSLIFWVLVVFAMLTLASPDKDDVTEVPDDYPHVMQHEVTQQDSLTRSHEGAHSGVDATGMPAMTRSHLPVSRPVYAAQGKRPKRRHHHHLVHTLIRHAK